MYKFIQSESANRIFTTLSQANLSTSDEPVKLAVELLYNHASIMSRVFKRTTEDMLQDVEVSLISDLKDILATSPAVTRYYQLLGQESNLISDRQMAVAHNLRNAGATNEQIIEATHLVWCELDGTFKGFCFEPIEFRAMPIQMYLENPDRKRYCDISISKFIPSHSLYEAYPDLINLGVAIRDLNGSAGQLCVETGTIFIDSNHIHHYQEHGGIESAMEFVSSAINHELAHYVQFKEPTWSYGVSQSRMDKSYTAKLIEQSIARYLKVHPEFGKLVDEYSRFAKKLQAKYNVDERDLFDVMTPLETEQLLEKINKFGTLPEATVFTRLRDSLDEVSNAESISSLSWYKRVSGETLARMAETIHSNIALDEKLGRTKESSFISHLAKASQEAGIPLYRGTSDYDYKYIGSPRGYAKQSLGFIDFYENGQSMISLIKDKSNLSTVIHEFLGHYIYENLQKASALEDCPRWIKNGLNQLDSTVFQDLIGTHAKHERFSELVEAYFSDSYSDQTPEIKALSVIVSKELELAVKAPPLASEMLEDATYYYPFSEFYNELVSDSRARQGDSPEP